MSSYYPLSRDDIKNLAVCDGQGRLSVAGVCWEWNDMAMSIWFCFQEICRKVFEAMIYASEVGVW